MTVKATRRGLLGLAGALSVSQVGLAQSPENVAISLASKSLVAAAPVIARELGLFQKHGLNPQFTVMDSANAATAALVSRSVEVAISGSADAIAAQARGQKVVIVANTYNGLSGSLVLAKSVGARLGIAPTAPVPERLKALEGLVVASTSPTSSFTISYRAAAKAAGANIRFTYMALPAMGAALESGAVQGIIATAPYWVFPVLKDAGVLWISAPRGDLPADFMPASSADLQMMRDVAETKPGLARALAAIVADYVRALEERPAEVKAAIAKLYPDLSAPTIDLIFDVEVPAWRAKVLTPADMAHEIAYVRLSGAPIPLDGLDPAALLFP